MKIITKLLIVFLIIFSGCVNTQEKGEVTIDPTEQSYFIAEDYNYVTKENYFEKEILLSPFRIENNYQLIFQELDNIYYSHSDKDGVQVEVYSDVIRAYEKLQCTKECDNTDECITYITDCDINFNLSRIDLDKELKWNIHPAKYFEFIELQSTYDDYFFAVVNFTIIETFREYEVKE